MKKVLILLAVCLFLPFVGQAQTRKPVRKATPPVTKTVEPPSANGKFKFDWTKGFTNDSDGKDYIIITVPGKSTSEIKSSVVSSLSDMYSNPSKVISTLGDNIINVTGYYAKKTFWSSDGDATTYYNFNYNIKIEIKDGKIKVSAPTISNITGIREIGYYNAGSSNVDLGEFYTSIRLRAPSDYQKIFEKLFNPHITNIVKGLSSDSDW